MRVGIRVGVRGSNVNVRLSVVRARVSRSDDSGSWVVDNSGHDVVVDVGCWCVGQFADLGWGSGSVLRDFSAEAGGVGGVVNRTGAAVGFD